MSYEALERRLLAEATLRVTPRIRAAFEDALTLVGTLPETPPDYRTLAKQIVLHVFHTDIFRGLEGTLPGSGTSTVTISLLTGHVEIWLFQHPLDLIPAEILLESLTHELVHIFVAGRDEVRAHRLSNLLMGVQADDYAARSKWSVDLQEIVLKNMADPSFLDVLRGTVSKRDAMEARWAIAEKMQRIMTGWERASLRALLHGWEMLRGYLPPREVRPDAPGQKILHRDR